MHAVRAHQVHGKIHDHHHRSFMGRRSFTPRPLSEATEFSDTDFEDDDYLEDELTSRSASSQTTESTFESVKTPDTGCGLSGFDFRFDEKPMVDRSPLDAEAVDLYFGMSPTGDVPIKLSPPASPPSDLLNRQLSSRKNASDKLDETNVRSWTPEDVADWMCDAGHDDSVVDKFLGHDIDGLLLLDLKQDDLKELGIIPHTKRDAVFESIKLLRARSRASIAPILPPDLLPKEEPIRKAPTPMPRRGRISPEKPNSAIMPGESVSIVAIEQVMPKPHICAKGENCKKWQRQQVQIKQMQEEMDQLQNMPRTPMTTTTNATRPSVVAPSTAASSDVFGSSLAPPPTRSGAITLERLNGLKPVDPQESVRQFLGFQHVPSSISANSQPLAEKLRNMPRLTIPSAKPNNLAPFSPNGHPTPTPRTVITPVLRRSKTPISAIRHPSSFLQAPPKFEKVSYNPSTPPDIYRLSQPFSELDVPVTSPPEDPTARDTSHSVPPDMRFRPSVRQAPEPVPRPQSAHQIYNPRQQRHPSFAAPQVPRLPEEELTTPITAISSTGKSPFQSPPRPLARTLSISTPAHGLANTMSGQGGRSLQSPTEITSIPPPRCATTPPREAPPPRCSTVPPRPVPETFGNRLNSPPYTSSSTFSSPRSSLATSASLKPAATLSGPMRRRRTTKLLRHEWQDTYVSLTGTSLKIYASEEAAKRDSRPLEIIDVDEYAVACANSASSKKLGSGFYKSILGKDRSSKYGSSSLSNPDSMSLEEPSKAEGQAFAFSLMPISKSSTGEWLQGMAKKEAHYFCVATRDERMDWMRELMLAKALKKGRETVKGSLGGRVEIDGVMV